MSRLAHFQRVALIGFGLIGGSIARAAKREGLAGEIVTTARSEQTRARVAEIGIVDQVVATNAEAVQDADLVIYLSGCNADCARRYNEADRLFISVAGANIDGLAVPANSLVSVVALRARTLSAKGATENEP